MSAVPRPEPISPRILLVRLALCAVLTGGATAPAWAAVPSATPVPYQVQPGDTLRKIALRFYGSKRYWEHLYRANRKTVGRNPDLIHTGSVVTLPRIPGVGPVTPAKVETRLPDPPRLPAPAPTPEPSVIELPPVVLEPEPVTPAPTPEPTPDAPMALPAAGGRVSPYWPAAASLVLPGSAQLARGDWDRGIAHLGLTALSLGAFQLGARNADPGLQWTAGLGLVGISLWSAWDAFQQAEAVTQP